MISNAQIFAIIFSAAVSFLFPLIAMIVWRKKTHARIFAAVTGAVIFFVFAMVLEQVMHVLVLRPNGYVLSHTWSYVLYGTLAAGVFEETGRLVGFKLLLKRQTGRETGVMCGLGHGGMESLLLCTVAMVTNLVVALQLNAAGGNVDALSETFQTLAASLTQMPAGQLALSGLERVLAICLHTALSVLVFQAVNRPGKFWLYPAAIALHAGVDVFAALRQRGVISMYVSELLVLAAVVVVCLIAVKLYRADLEKTEEPVEISAENE